MRLIAAQSATAPTSIHETASAATIATTKSAWKSTAIATGRALGAT